MGIRIKTGDTVKVIAGKDKGSTGKVVKVDASENLIFVDGIGKRTRHTKPTQHQKGGKKDIHGGIQASNVKLVIDEKTGATSRVGFVKNAEGKTVRVAKQANNREIK
ncbi:MAG: 50S ribosomal protein L24 [Candidatus Nomurabacteria bacterium]|jgi:large subunit ribosomal protein L24|nr:50S ribosomal protein L24 [Candidatus Nomurabacteria bacterium]